VLLILRAAEPERTIEVSMVGVPVTEVIISTPTVVVCNSNPVTQIRAINYLAQSVSSIWLGIKKEEIEVFI
jgi:hypothetical protein